MMFFELKINNIGAVDQLQVKLEKTAKITYWQAKKQITRYRVTHLEVSEEEEKYD